MTPKIDTHHVERRVVDRQRDRVADPPVHRHVRRRRARQLQQRRLQINPNNRRRAPRRRSQRSVPGPAGDVEHRVPLATSATSTTRAAAGRSRHAIRA